MTKGVSMTTLIKIDKKNKVVVVAKISLTAYDSFYNAGYKIIIR